MSGADSENPVENDTVPVEENRIDRKGKGKAQSTQRESIPAVFDDEDYDEDADEDYVDSGSSDDDDESEITSDEESIDETSDFPNQEDVAAGDDGRNDCEEVSELSNIKDPKSDKKRTFDDFIAGLKKKKVGE